MRYHTILIALLSSLVASTQSAAIEEDATNYVLPNAFMIYDVLGHVNQDKFDWRVKYVDLVAPRMGTCIAANKECNALGVHTVPRRRYFMSIGEVPVPIRRSEVTVDVTLTSSSVDGDSYNGKGTITLQCNEDECASDGRFFLPIGNVPYTTYRNDGSTVA